MSAALPAPLAFRVTPRVEGLTLAPSADWPADPPNLYLIRGDRAWAMVDAGWGRAEDERAIDAWLARSRPVGQPGRLFVSHAHHDHIGGARALGARHGLRPSALPAEHATALRHALDAEFADLDVGERFDLGGVGLTVLAAPGHTEGSMALHLTTAPDGAADEDVLFTGDTVVGRHSAWVGPPDGDLDVYLATLARLADPAAPWAGARLAPGHGPAGAAVGPAAEALRQRRLGRDEDILALLAAGPATARTLAIALYGDGEDRILGPGGVAERTVAAHLTHLRRLGRVTPTGADDEADAHGLRMPFRRLP